MTEQSEWIGKTEAAERLKISERTVLGLASKGRIASKKERNPETNQTAVKFKASDVERYGFERDNHQELANGAQTSQVAPIARRGNPYEVSAISDMWEIVKEAAKPKQRKRWLTIKEAEQHSGLPASILVKLIESGKLPALNCGPRVGGKWRISRKDLDALAGDKRTP